MGTNARIPWGKGRLALALLALLAIPPIEATADSLQLRDGRFLDGVTIRKVDNGLNVHFQNGVVFVPSDLVRDYLSSDDAGEFVPRTDEEKAKLEKGLVPFEGQWVTKAKRDALLQSRREQKEKQLADLKAHREWRNRYKKTSKRFAVEFTIPPEVAQNYIDLLETYYDVFTKKWGIRADAKEPKLPVYIYHDRKTFNRSSGAKGGVIGYFRFVEPKELHLFYDRIDERLTIDVLFHEANHYLTHLIDPKFDYPSWVNESLAEYYGASEWDPVKKQMSVGHLQESRIVALKDAIAANEWLGLEEMIRIERFSAIHYAWGWSFVHYLMENARYSAKFQKFYIGLAKDKSMKRIPASWGMVQVAPDEQIKALKSYLGLKDLKDLEKEWHDYVRTGLDFQGERGFEKAADYARSHGLEIKAKRYYSTAIERGSKNPLTYHNYGRLLLDGGEVDKGIDLVKKAIELDPLNARFYATLARGLDRKGAQDKAEAERLRKLALEIDPDDFSLQLEVDVTGLEED